MTTKILLAVAIACGVAHADPPRETQKIAITAKPSVVRVWAAYTGTFELYGHRYEAAIGGTGSGWFMTPDGYIATNAHVVETIQKGEDKAKRELEFQVLDRLPYDPWVTMDVMKDVKVVEIKKRAYVVLPNGDKLDYKIKRYGQPATGRDVAILKVDITNAPTLPIGDSAQAQVEDRVVVIGYPGVADFKQVLDGDSELEPSITDGTVSAIKTAATGEPIVQISAPITHGNSGGPALDAHGNVIGLVTFSNDKNVQGFNFLVASQTLDELVREARIVVEPSETSIAWRTGLDQFWRDDYSEAIESFEQVRKLFPADTEAAHMVELAKQAKKDGKERSHGSSGLVGALVAVGFLALFAGVGVIVLRRKSAPAQEVIVAKTIAIGPRAYGECVSGRLVGQRFAVPPGGIVVGRHPSAAQVVVDDIRASSKHVWIGYDGGELVAYDYGTTNGTYVNGGRITRAALRDGDVVIVGQADCLALKIHA